MKTEAVKKMVEPLKTGKLLAKEGFINPEDIDRALTIQKKREESLSFSRHRYLGMILCDLNLITPVDNYFVLHKYNKVKSLQAVLEEDKLLDRGTVRQLEKISEEKQRSFLSILISSRKLPSSRIQKYLFDLFHVPLRSVKGLVFNESCRDAITGVIDSEMSRRLKLVPLILKENTLLVGITDPDHLVAIHELNIRFPQYRFKAVFIPFSGFAAMFDTLYKKGNAKAPDPPPVPEKEQFLDLSLLLKYQVIISDPVVEKAAVSTLYQRYEQLRRLAGHPGRESLEAAFHEFICNEMDTILRRFQSERVSFSFKKEGDEVQLIALPIQQDDTCQK